DEIHGGDGDDTILQLDGGSKTVYAEGGDDLIYLDIIADDVIDGGEGLDSLSFENISVVAPSVIDLANQTATINSVVYTFTSIEGVFGTAADDIIIGNVENNILFGGNGDGVTFLGNDTLRGGAGDDIYFVGSSLDFRPLPSQPALPTPVIGSDIVDDSSGDADAIEFSDYYELADLTFTAVGSNLVISFAEGDITIQNHFGSGKVEDLILSNGLTLDMDDYEDWTAGDATDNVLVATSANEALYGGDGNDTLSAHVGGGNLYGGSGIDTLIGNAGDDTLIGGTGIDTLTGNAGNDTLTGGAGDDVLNGGDGDDTYMFSLGDGNNTITDTSGFDVIQVETGITFDDITFTQMGNDLDIQIASGFLVKDFYLGNVVEEMRFDDGTSFDLTTLLSIDDTFIGTSAVEVFDGGSGVDTVDYSASTSRVFVNLATGVGELGDAEGDTYISIENVIGTNKSFDHLYGNAANNHLQGLIGEDRLYGSGGSDIMDGGAGDGDTVYYRLSDSAVDVDLLRATQVGGYAEGDVLLNVERVSGSIYYDTLKGDNDNNRLYGKDGDDVLDGRDGDDRLYGGNDRDIIYGGNGDDDLFGGDGNDELFGGAGSDDLDGGAGFDKAVFDDVYSNYTITATDVTDNVGSGGVDTIVNVERLVFADGYYEDNVFTVNLAPIAQNDSFSADEGTLITGNLLLDNGNGVDSDPDGDALNVIADTYLTSNGSVVIASEGSVIVSSDGSFAYMANIGYSGTDRFVYTLQDAKGGTVRGTVDINVTSLTSTINDIFVGTSALNSFDGGVGVDTVDYSASASRVRVNLDTGLGGAGEANGDTYTSIENIIGTNFIYDELYGDAGTNHIQALGGEDRLYGSGGADIMDGGEGSDIIYYRLSDSAVDVDLLRITQVGGYAEGDVLLNIQYVAGSNYGDILKGDHGYNKLYGKDGNDTLYGRDGDDKLYGGNDNDILYGGEGSDYLYGNAGDDVLYGGAGVDMLYGQSGADTFTFESASAFSASDNI
ncbi:MAG: cadherin-like domain-containing protein, partial [Gammaproteobacteria bacterium]|nr:cadherin-like domain-containing protein [Gammaproteobacteria bacterium]